MKGQKDRQIKKKKIERQKDRRTEGVKDAKIKRYKEKGKKKQR